jgi:hypothetical protein
VVALMLGRVVGSLVGICIIRLVIVVGMSLAASADNLGFVGRKPKFVDWKL